MFIQEEQKGGKLYYIFIACIFILFCILWIKAASGELWCDEIWSLWLVEEKNSLTDLFHVKHDNNHLLNSIFIYFFHRLNISSQIFFRLHSIIVSIGSFIILLYIMQKNVGKFASVMSCAVFSLSYISMLLMTEARGYGLMIFSMLLSLLCFCQYKNSNQFRWLTAFAASEILAVLSHTSALFFLGMLALADIITSFLEKKNWLEKSRKIISLHAPGCVIGCLWILYFFNGIWIGYQVSEDDLGLTDTFLLLLSSIFGTLSFPSGSTVVGFILYCLFVVSIAAVFFISKKIDLLSILVLLMCVAFPATVIFVLRPPFVFPRYFLPLAPFIPIGIGILAERTHGKIRWGIIVFCIFIMVGNIPNIYQLERIGRGEYATSLEKILQSDKNPVIRIGSDARFMGELVLENAIAYSSKPERFQMVKQDDMTGADFLNSINYIFQVNTCGTETPPAEQPDGRGHIWKLIYFGKNPPFSGWNFYLYKKTD